MDTGNTEIKTRIAKIINTILPRYDGNVSLLGQLDSLGLFSLLPLLEDEFSVGIFSIEIDNENLRSIDTLTQLIENKLRNGKA